MLPRRLSILGVGLLGGSIGLAVKSAITSCEITGYGHRKSTLEMALANGVIDRAADSAAAAVNEADLVVLASPVGIFEQLLREIAPALREGAVVTDVGSTKRSVVRLAGEILPANVSFVGSHPMAGSERRGVEYARADLFKGALCILTPADARTDQAPDGVGQDSAARAIADFWRKLGMRTATMSPAEHDRLLADISHLPHVLASALVAMQHPAALELAGAGFFDTTRIAGGDGALWRDILLDNRDNVRASLLRLRQEVDLLLDRLDQQEAEPIRRWLDAAKERRAKVVQKRLREMTGE